MREFLKVALAIMLSLSSVCGALAQGYSPAGGLPLSGGTMSGPIHMGTSAIDGLPTPATDSSAATKLYVDTHSAGGTVTSVGLTGDNIIFNTSVTNSPITSSGSLVPTLKTVTANFGLFGPTTGSAATPTYRALVAADIPSLSSVYVPVARTVTAGTGLSGGGALSSNITLTNTGLLSISGGGAVSNQFVTSVTNSAGALSVTLAQASFSNISGTASTGQIPDLSAIYSPVAGNASLITVGTISSGTWNGSPLTASYVPAISALTGTLSLSQMPTQADLTVLGNVSGGAAVPVALTATQLTTVPNLATTALKGQHPAATSGQIAIGQASGSIAAETMSGDATLAANGAITLKNSGVSAATYTNATVTFDAQGRATSASSGTAPVTSVTGTSNRITSSGGATPAIDISASYVGQSSITTLGTIATGVWNGTAVPVLNGGTGATTASSARTNLSAAASGANTDITSSNMTTLSAINALSIPPSILSTTPSYTIQSTDSTVCLVSNSTVNSTYTLPLAASNIGRLYFVKNGSTGENALTLACAGSEVFVGPYGNSPGNTATSLTLRNQESVLIVGRSSGSWHVIANTRWPIGTYAAISTTTDYSAGIATFAPQYVNADASGGAVSVTPPAAANIAGKTMTVTNVGATGAVTVVGTFDGVSGITLSNQWDTVTLYCNGTNWTVLNANTKGSTNITVTHSGGIDTIAATGLATSGANVNITSLGGMTGNVTFTNVAGGIVYKAGSNGRAGTGTLSGGVLLINNSSITASTLVQLTGRGGTLTNAGTLYEDFASRVNGVSFTVKSLNVLDGQDFSYQLVEQQ